MPDKPPGRDQGVALLRMVRILTVLANQAPGWANRDRIIHAVGYGAAGMDDKRDQLRRDLRHLEEIGWKIEKDGRSGDRARLRLVDQDPRLATLLTGPQLDELARAAKSGGLDPVELGLPPRSTRTPTVPVSLRASSAFRLETSLHALHHRCLLHVRYNDKDRELHVDRVFQTSTGRWRVVAWDGVDQKQYRLDRFESMRVDHPGTARAIHPDQTHPDPLDYPDGEPLTAVVRMPAEHERQVIRELGRPLNRSTQGPQVDLSIRVVNRPLWRMRLYQLGERVTLVGPPELRDEVRDELRAFAEGSS